MQINGSLADAGSPGDVIDRGFIVAVTNEQLGGRIEDSLFPFFFLIFPYPASFMIE